MTNQVGRQVHDRVGLTMKEGICALLVRQCPQTSCIKTQYSDTRQIKIYSDLYCIKTDCTVCTLPASTR